jgi:ABC-2 type transport system permease protein
MMMTALLIMTREYQNKTLHGLLAIAGNRRSAILFGKFAPYAGIFLAISLGVIGILFPMFNINLAGGFWPTLIAIALFIAASLAPGMLLGLLIHSPVFALTVAIVINMPAFIFGGFTFPAWAMPSPIAAIAQWLPFTHFSSMFFKACLINAPFSYCNGEIMKLLLFALLPIIPSWVLLHGHVKKRRTMMGEIR